MCSGLPVGGVGGVVALHCGCMGHVYVQNIYAGHFSVTSDSKYICVHMYSNVGCRAGTGVAIYTHGKGGRISLWDYL